jgi:cell wall-associated NlpC family hydrolase
VSLPRTADGQAAKGLAIKKVSDLKPGDLVFFETYAPGISHVGIYIGGGKFIHASNPREGVKITSISSTSYASDFRGGTRILK